MRLSRSGCEQFRRVCSGSLAETSGAIVDSVIDAIRAPLQRHITKSAAVLRYHGVKDPVSHASVVTGQASSNHCYYWNSCISYHQDSL
jgi:hypothetical protein